jgi:hypothetical protein
VAVGRAGGEKPATRPAFVTPLPPRRPADLTPLPLPAGKTQPAPEPEKPAAPSTCLATFAERGGITLPSASENGPGACSVEDPVTFRGIALVDGSKVELDSAVTVSCAFALEILGWVRDDLPDIMTGEKGKLTGLVGVGGHACRPRNGMAGAPISEHATGNALDLSGFHLQDGRTVSLAGRGTLGLVASFARGRLARRICKEMEMPAKSAAQQKAAGAALAAKRGDIKKSELKGASRSMEKSMSEKQLDELASTKRKGKPEHVSKS